MNVPLFVARLHGLFTTRPGSHVFHVYAGPTTPSGRFVPRACRAVCNAHTGRLTVIERTGERIDLAGRRMCGRCSARLASLAGRAERYVSRDDWLAAYAGVTLGDLATAATVCTTVDETHGVGFVATLVHGPAPVRRPAVLSKLQARYDLEALILRRRRELVAASRTPDELEELRRRREDEEFQRAVVMASRRREDQIARAVDRRNRGQYLMPHEREALAAHG